MSYPYAFWLRDTSLFNSSSRKRTTDRSIVTPDPIEEMPATQRRRRSYGGIRPRGRKMVLSVPRAIRTRGTPEGYYEIPANILLRFYFNTSTGIWVTDQTTGQASGATGYPGLGFRFTDTAVVIHFGDGAISTTSSVTFPNAFELNSIFDEMKTAKVMMEYWVANQTPGGHTTTAYDPEFWAVIDTNDATPPSRDAVQSYAKCTRILTDRPTRHSYVPKLSLDAVADGGAGGTTAAAMSTNGYVRTGSIASLMGSKLYYFIPYTGASTFVGYLNIKITLIRRFKRTR